MKGGLCDSQPGQIKQVTIGPNINGKPSGNIFKYYNNNSIKEYNKLRKNYNNWTNDSQNIVIKCNEQGKYYYEVNIVCNGQVNTYKHLPPTNIPNKNRERYFYNTFEAAKENAKLSAVQISLVKLALLHTCSKPLTQATNS
jgi:hypothetical protein